MLSNPNYEVVIRDFWSTRKFVEKSPLFEVLNKMPKGAIHHIHTSAAPPVSAYLELTKNPIVYYNEKE